MLHIYFLVVIVYNNHKVLGKIDSVNQWLSFINKECIHRWFIAVLVVLIL